MTRSAPPEACLIILVDCSESMRSASNADEGGVCGESVAQRIEQVIEENEDGQRLDTAILAYFTDRFGEPRVSLVAACDGFIESLENDAPNWLVRPAGRLTWGAKTRLEFPQGGGSPACQALEACAELLAPWIRRHSAARPPIVLHVTDGQVGDGEPARAAERLLALRTACGPLLLVSAVCGVDAPVEQCVPSCDSQAAFVGGAAHYAIWRQASSSLAKYQGETWSPLSSLKGAELYPVVDDSLAVIYCRTNDDFHNVAMLTLSVALGY